MKDKTTETAAWVHPEAPSWEEQHVCTCGLLITECADAYSHLSEGY